MACCHADFATVEGSDCGFTLGMPTFTFFLLNVVEVLATRKPEEA